MMRLPLLFPPALLALVLPGQSASRPTSGLTPTLERSLHWTGGARGWEALTHLRCEGTFTLGDREGRLVVAFERGGRVRQEYEFAGLRGAEGIDAQGPWRSNQSGQIEGLPEPIARQLRESLALAFGGLYRGTTTPVVDLGRRERAGRVFDVVALDPEPGERHELWFTPEGELRFRDESGAAGTSTTEFTDWRSVGGVRMPFSERRTGKDPRALRWTSIVANEEARASRFDRDGARPRNGAIAAGAASARIPLDLHLERYLFVKGSIAGTATDLVLDSGAGITVVDRELADRVGLVGSGDVNAKGIGGATRKVQLAKDVTIALGAVKLEHLTVAILDLSEVHEKLGRRMPVILGKELFHAFTVECDYENAVVTVHDPERWEAPTHAHVAPTRPLADGHVMIELAFEDLPPAWFLVDTGSGDTLSMHQPYVAAKRLLARYPRAVEHRVGGVGGTLPAKAVTAAAVHLGGQTFRQVPVVLATEPKGAFASQESAGTLGAGLLTRFTVTFDYRRQRICFVPNGQLARPFAKDRLGLGATVREGKLVVEYVSAGSPAEAAGVRAGDEITSVAGTQGVPSDLRSALRAAARDRERDALHLGLGSREVTVMLAEFY